MITLPVPALEPPDAPAAAAALLLKLQRGATRAWDAWHAFPAGERLNGSPQAVLARLVAEDADEAYSDLLDATVYLGWRRTAEPPAKFAARIARQRTT